MPRPRREEPPTALDDDGEYVIVTFYWVTRSRLETRVYDGFGCDETALNAAHSKAANMRAAYRNNWVGPPPIVTIVRTERTRDVESKANRGFNGLDNPDLGN